MTSPATPDAPVFAPRSRLVRAGVVLAGAVLLAVASWAQIPMIPVPMTLQTLALFLIAGLAGPRLTFEIVAVWLLCAAIGLPVLAGGKGGLEALTGPTAGFLAAFLVVGPVVAWFAAKRSFQLWLILLFIAGHIAILMIGWAWLAPRVGADKAFTGAVQPFLVGAVVKSAVAGLLVVLAKARLFRARNS